MAEVAIADIRFGVITVSDRCSRGEGEDQSGPRIVRHIAQAGGAVLTAQIVADDLEAISLEILSTAKRCDVVLTTGGTGLSPTDITPEATMHAMDREAPGIAEMLRAIGRQKNPMADLSRGVSVLVGKCLVINLPGSPNAVRELMEPLLKLLPHAVAVLRGDSSHD